MHADSGNWYDFEVDRGLLHLDLIVATGERRWDGEVKLVQSDEAACRNRRRRRQPWWFRKEIVTGLTRALLARRLTPWQGWMESRSPKPMP